MKDDKRKHRASVPTLTEMPAVRSFNVPGRAFASCANCSTPGVAPGESCGVCGKWVNALPMGRDELLCYSHPASPCKGVLGGGCRHCGRLISAALLYAQAKLPQQPEPSASPLRSPEWLASRACLSRTSERDIYRAGVMAERDQWVTALEAMAKEQPDVIASALRRVAAWATGSLPKE